MPPQAAQVLGLLLKREFLSRHTMDVLGVADQNQTVWRIRRALGSKSLIRSRYGEGYYIDAKDKERVRKIVSGL